MNTRKFKGFWTDLLDCIEAAVESGEPRAEVTAWAEHEYNEYESAQNSMAASEAGEFDEPVWDVQGRL